MDTAIRIERHVPLADLVTEKLENMILKGVLLPEVRLKEDKLASELGVSRTSLREALYNLTNLGFVERRKTGGWTVGSIQAKDVLARHELKTMLEANAIRRSVKKDRTEIVAKLHEMIEVMEDVHKQGDNRQYRKIDTEFHNCLLLLHSNDYLTQLYTDNQKYLEWLKNISITPFIGMKKSLEQHKRIIAELENDNIEGAIKELLLHDEENTKKMENLIKNLNFIK